MQRFFYSGVVLFLTLTGAYASENHCLPWGLARLRESENCRWEWKISADESICVPRRFIARLRTSSRCGEGAGVWKISSSGTRTWQIQSWSASGEGVSAAWNILIRVQSFREELSEKWKSVDRFGIWRKLILDESLSALGWWRRLGFVHVLSVSGIHLLALIRVRRATTAILVGTGWVSYGVSWWVGRGLDLFLAASLFFLSGFRIGFLRVWIYLMFKEYARARGYRLSSWAWIFLLLCIEVGMGWIFGWSEERQILGSIYYFTAVSGSLLLVDGVMNRGWKLHVAMSLASFYALAGVELIQHHSVSPFTPLLSFIFVPIFAEVLFPLTFLSLPLGYWSESLMHWQSEGWRWFLGQLLQVKPYWLLRVEDWGMAMILLGVAGGVSQWIPGDRSCGLVRARHVVRILILGVGVWIWAIPVSPPLPLATRVIQLDVGQGDAALVEYRIQSSEAIPHYGLIDAGPAGHSSETWVRQLSRFGVNRLDWVALSHLDEDHTGGIRTLTRMIRVGEVSSSAEVWSESRSERWKMFLREQGIPIRDWSAASIPFPVHSPLYPQEEGANMHMSAFWIPLPNADYLGAGDMEAQDELRLIAWIKYLRNQHPTRSHVLKVGHHGSRFSTHPDFLRQLNFDEAWISVGRINSYGHPSLDAISRLSRAGLRLRLTSEEGDLDLRPN